MTPLGQRILRRAVPVGVATTVVGYALLQVYLAAARGYVDPAALDGVSPSVQGPLIFGLIGFAIAAAVEYGRSPKSPKAPAA
jgi:hypothetical protein